MKNFEDLGRDFDEYMVNMEKLCKFMAAEIKALKDRVKELEAKK